MLLKTFFFSNKTVPSVAGVRTTVGNVEYVRKCVYTNFEMVKKSWYNSSTESIRAKVDNGFVSTPKRS